MYVNWVPYALVSVLFFGNKRRSSRCPQARFNLTERPNYGCLATWVTYDGSLGERRSANGDKRTITCDVLVVWPRGYRGGGVVHHNWTIMVNKTM